MSLHSLTEPKTLSLNVVSDRSEHKDMRHKNDSVIASITNVCLFVYRLTGIDHPRVRAITTISAPFLLAVACSNRTEIISCGFEHE